MDTPLTVVSRSGCAGRPSAHWIPKRRGGTAYPDDAPKRSTHRRLAQRRDEGDLSGYVLNHKEANHGAAY